MFVPILYVDSGIDRRAIEERFGYGPPLQPAKGMLFCRVTISTTIAVTGMVTDSYDQSTVISSDLQGDARNNYIPILS